MAKMKYGLLIFLSLFMWSTKTQALEVKHYMQTTIGLFDACEETFSYAFYKDKDYDIKTSVSTSGTFGALYPFTATYHSVGTYDKSGFKPQDYYYETQTRFTHRSKEIVYDKGVPQYRISVKNEHKRKDEIVTNPKYSFSGDLSVFRINLITRPLPSGLCLGRLTLNVFSPGCCRPMHLNGPATGVIVSRPSPLTCPVISSVKGYSELSGFA